MTNTPTHWDNIYQNQKHSQVSWHQTQSTISLDWILKFTNKNDSIIDVGCGVSILADNLIDKGYTNLSLLELSNSALSTIKERLKNHAEKVHFHHENVLEFKSNNQFSLWHDRAVFHFLTDEKDQKTYIKKLTNQVKKGGYFLLSTFSPSGPKLCSKLDIVQYDVKKITQLLGGSFKLIKNTSETHSRPNGNTQDFNYFLFQKID